MIFSFSSLPRSKSSNLLEIKSTASLRSRNCLSLLIWLVLLDEAKFFNSFTSFLIFFKQFIKISTHSFNFRLSKNALPGDVGESRHDTSGLSSLYPFGWLSSFEPLLKSLFLFFCLKNLFISIFSMSKRGAIKFIQVCKIFDIKFWYIIFSLM